MARPEHTFAQYIRTIGKGKTGRRSLTQSEANEAMQLILQGALEPVQLGAFLMVLRVKEESGEEIAGFVESCRAFIRGNAGYEALNRDAQVVCDLDWPSYAGKKRQPPWYLLAARLLSDAGYKVFMHGAKGHTANRVYSEDILRQLGFTIADGWQQVGEQLQQQRFSYLPLAQMCPPLHDIIELRPLLGLRSPVHTLVRLLNPLSAGTSMQSVFHPSYADTHHQAAMLLKERNAAVFKGEGGEVEYRPQAELVVRAVRDALSEQYVISRRLDSQAAGKTSVEQTIEQSVSDLQSLWDETQPNEYGLEAVLGTTAIALNTLGAAADFNDGLAQAKEVWRNRPASIC